MTVRSETVSAAGAEEAATVQRCCCSESEPEPKYLCYDKGHNRLFHPVEGLSKPSAKQQLTGSGMEELSFRPKMLVTSECGSGGSNWTKSGPASAATPLQVPEAPVDYPGTSRLYIRPAPLQFEAYAFKDKKRYPKYDEKSFPRENHITVNGVIYGPTDEHKEKNTIHGTPFCAMWERTAEVKVSAKSAKFSAKDNRFDYKLECEPRDICREWVIAHACGFDHGDVVLVKRVGRTGQCVEVESGLIRTKCPTGSYHNSVSFNGGFRFCDCEGPAECKVG